MYVLNIFRKEQGSNINIAKQKQIESELDNLPPIEDLKISVPETSCELCGEVIVDSYNFVKMNECRRQ